MSEFEQIQNGVKQLSKAEQEVLLDWLTNLVEDGLELTDAFKTKIEQAKADIAAGRFRVRQP